MKVLLMLGLLGAMACGYSSRDNEVIGQVKKVANATPIFCSDYVSADLSLGVMRNGVGSMSTEDVWFYVTDPTQVELLKQAAETGHLVKARYDELRVTFCTPEHRMLKVELVE